MTRTAVTVTSAPETRRFTRGRTVVAVIGEDLTPKLLSTQPPESFGLGVGPLGRRLGPVGG